jgi:hypothetical protein
MLQLSTVGTETLELLKFLMIRPEFNNLRLVGGTALALQLGHRISVDLDLFGNIDYEDIDQAKTFESYNEVVVLKRSANINMLSINNIKVDFVNYSYPWLEEPVLEKGIRLAGRKDIAAMKLAAVTGRGTKKDFVDLYFLFQEFDLGTMIGFYNQKYFDGSDYLVLKSLTYFEDAEKDLDLQMLKEVSWPDIKKFILHSVASYLSSDRS